MQSLYNQTVAWDFKTSLTGACWDCLAVSTISVSDAMSVSFATSLCMPVAGTSTALLYYAQFSVIVAYVCAAAAACASDVRVLMSW